MPNKSPEVGAKTSLYPHGYGFCQCGCGQRTQPSLSGIYPMYLSKPASRSKSARDPVLREIYHMKLQQESAMLNIKTITDDVEGVGKFVKDFWNSTNREKQIALDRLTRILRELKSLNNASTTTDLSRRTKPGHDTRDKL